LGPKFAPREGGEFWRHLRSEGKADGGQGRENRVVTLPIIVMVVMASIVAVSKVSIMSTIVDIEAILPMASIATAADG
jgi:hypothetical protein